jgi:glycosyltransferase involved in cell wall biosynthesis
MNANDDKSSVINVVDWPRITIVTAVRNCARYIDEAICSVLDQGYPNLEYIIVDGLSTDGTVDIIRKYEKHLAWWVTQSDKNVYQALNTGFSGSSGQILGWLNGSDKLHPKSLYVVGSVFGGLPSVEWITGRPTQFSEDGMAIGVFAVPRWSRQRYLAGANRHIQQESTFWRRSLWERAGASLSESYKDVGDVDLWVRFFRHARLYPIDALIGGWRQHPDSISHSDLESYNRNLNTVIELELEQNPDLSLVQLLKRTDRTIKRIPKVRVVWQRLVMDAIIWYMYHMPGSDLPPTIRYQEGRWQLQTTPMAGRMINYADVLHNR